MTVPSQLIPIGRSGRGTLSQAGRLHVLTLEGEPYELGFQHGALLKPQIAAGCAPVFGGSRGFEDLLARLTPTEAAGARRLIDGLYALIEEGLDEVLKAELAGLAAGADLPVEILTRATFRSEILQVLAAMDAVSDAPGECTALVALAARTQEGRLLHAKNQDYDGAGLWDLAPTVTIVRTPGAIPHVRVGTAGLLKASFGMNAAGLTVGGHLLFSRHAAPAGQGFTAFEHTLLRRADSLAAAREILESGPRWGAFAFVVADGAHDEAMAFECDSQSLFVRSPREGRLACANHFTADGEAERDLLLGGGVARNSLARLERASTAGGAETLSPALMADILADRYDACCGAVRSLGQTIAGPLTVMSVIAEPATRRLWVSQGEAPTCDGPYVGFDLGEAFEGGPIRLLGSFGPGSFADSGQRAALRASLAARRTLEEEGPAAALALLQEAVELDGVDPAHRRILARALIRLERFEDALTALDLPATAPQSPNERAEAAYLAAVALDGLGRREDAVARLRGLLDADPDERPLQRLNPNLIKLARRHQDAAFTADHARRLPMGFTLHSGVE